MIYIIDNKKSVLCAIIFMELFSFLIFSEETVKSESSSMSDSTSHDNGEAS